jgi:hypothetical protein
MAWITREPDCGLKCQKEVAEGLKEEEEEDTLTAETVVTLTATATAEGPLLAVI